MSVFCFSLLVCRALNRVLVVMVGLLCKHNIERCSFLFLYNVGLYPKLSNHLASQNEASQWRSEGRAWSGTCPARVRPAHMRASTSVVSAMVKHTAWYEEH